MVLRDHQAAQETLKIMLGGVPVSDDLVFANPDGSSLLPDTVTHAWAKLSRRTGLPVRLHDARHTHASLMLRQNVRPKVVQERLGHATIATTFDTYSHVLPGMQKKPLFNSTRGSTRLDRGAPSTKPLPQHDKVG